MYFGVCVLVMNDDGNVLSVSRKDDPNDVGLPGGKVEPGETPIEAAIRELYEETGYKIIDARYAQLVYHAEDGAGKLAVTYTIPVGALKKVNEPTEKGVVEWLNPSVLAKGKTFGEYNRGLFKTIGIRYNYSTWEDNAPGYDYLKKAAD